MSESRQSFLRQHWVAISGLVGGIGIPLLYMYLQLVVWKRHGDDLMLTASGIVVTILLWLLLVVGILRYWKHGSELNRLKEGVGVGTQSKETAMIAESSRQIVQLKHELQQQKLDSERELKQIVTMKDSDYSTKLAEREQYWVQREAETNRRVSEQYKKLAAEYEPYKELFEPLQLEAFQLARELREWLTELGPQPTVIQTDKTHEGMVKFLNEKNSVEQPWAERFTYGYAARFRDRVLNIGQRLRERNVASAYFVLENQAQAVGDVSHVEAIIKGLRDTAIRLERDGTAGT